jgi:dTDP-4-amino-4,6-dideoxygalactose transaminase
MRVPLFDLTAQHAALGRELEQVWRDTLGTSGFVAGEAVAAFQAQLASYLGGGNVVSCGNGTDALEIAMEALGIGEGDEVIVPAMTWISTAEAVARIGARPVFADILPGQWTIDPGRVAEAITPQTRAILPVHLYGRPARMKELRALCDRHDLLVIEDCAQSLGADIAGEKTGTLGDAAIVSFFPTKNIGALGDGGAMVFRDADIARRARLIANHGQSERHHHVLIGRNSRLDALNAAVLSLKLPLLDGWIEAKAGIARLYTNMLADCGLGLPPQAKGARHGWHLYTVTHPDRNALSDHLAARGIASAVHYPTALPEQPAFAPFDPDPSKCPVASRLGQSVLSLPLYPELEESQQAYVIEAVREFAV